MRWPGQAVGGVGKVVRKDTAAADDLGRHPPQQVVVERSLDRDRKGMLYRGLPAASWSKNHSRCWAKDSGNGGFPRHGQQRRPWIGVTAAPARGARARAATAGCSNSNRRGKSMPG